MASQYSPTEMCDVTKWCCHHGNSNHSSFHRKPYYAFGYTEFICKYCLHALPLELFTIEAAHAHTHTPHTQTHTQTHYTQVHTLHTQTHTQTHYTQVHTLHTLIEVYFLYRFTSGSDSSTIWLDDVDCFGNESCLLSCSYNGIGVS